MSLAFTIGAFSLVGLPPFIGFPSKVMIVTAALAKGQNIFIVLVGLVLLGTVIECAYFFRIVQTIYFKGKRRDFKREEAPVIVLIPIFILVILIVAIGIYPGSVTDILNSSASGLLNRVGYIRSVLG